MQILNYEKQLELKRQRLVPVESFLSTVCDFSKTNRVSGGQLYLAYTAFCKKHHYKPLSPIELYARVDNHPEIVKVLGKSGQLFLGISIQEKYQSVASNDQAVAILEGRCKIYTTPLLKEKLNEALRNLAYQNEQVCKLGPMLTRAAGGDPFWLASKKTLENNLATAERLTKELEVEIEALRKTLRARGEISN